MSEVTILSLRLTLRAGGRKMRPRAQCPRHPIPFVAPSMAKKRALILEEIESMILTIRGQKVMLDADLAKLYGVSTKQLNQQVKRNRSRFPDDFLFTLTADEKAEVVTNCDHLRRLKFSPTLP